LALLARTAGAQEAAAPQAAAPLPRVQLTPTTQEDSIRDEQAACKRKLPVRAERRWSLLGQAGINSMVGLGPQLSYHIDPHFTVEGAAGVSTEGMKTGVRARYNFTLSNVTPFLGVGAAHTFGFDDLPISESGSGADSDSEDAAHLRIKPSNSLQVSTGIDWIADNNVNLITSVGYSWRVGGNNVEVDSEQPLTHDQQKLVDSYGSGLLVAVALGYSF
jgi:hypothetical protein